MAAPRHHSATASRSTSSSSPCKVASSGSAPAPVPVLSGQGGSRPAHRADGESTDRRERGTTHRRPVSPRPSRQSGCCDRAADTARALPELTPCRWRAGQRVVPGHVGHCDRRPMRTGRRIPPPRRHRLRMPGESSTRFRRHVRAGRSPTRTPADRLPRRAPRGSARPGHAAQKSAGTAPPAAGARTMASKLRLFVAIIELPQKRLCSFVRDGFPDQQGDGTPENAAHFLRSRRRSARWCPPPVRTSCTNARLTLTLRQCRDGSPSPPLLGSSSLCTARSPASWV